MPRRPWPLRFASLLLALLALVGMTVRGLPPANAAGASDLAAIAALGGTICHDGAAGPIAPDAPAPLPGPCVLCPVCAMTGLAGFVPVAPFVVVAPDAGPRERWTLSAPPRAPPAVALIAAQPRGPPVLT